MQNQIDLIKDIIQELGNGYISNNEYRQILPYCLRINNQRGLFFNREYQVITEDYEQLRNKNKEKDEDYYKKMENFESDLFDIKSNSCSYRLYNGDSITLKNHKNIVRYLENIKILIQKIENHEELSDNDDEFYIM